MEQIAQTWNWQLGTLSREYRHCLDKLFFEARSLKQRQCLFREKHLGD